MRRSIETGGAAGKLAFGKWLPRLLAIAVLSLAAPLGIDQVNAQAAPPMSSLRLGAPLAVATAR